MSQFYALQKFNVDLENGLHKCMSDLYIIKQHNFMYQNCFDEAKCTVKRMHNPVQCPYC